MTVIQRWSRNLGLALRRRTCSDGKGNRLAEEAESKKTRKDHMARRKANVQLRRSTATKMRVDLIREFRCPSNGKLAQGMIHFHHE